MAHISSTLLPQTITFDPLANKTYGDPPFTVSATASSTLPVTFTSATPLVCTATGNRGATITILAAGQCTINANQEGGALPEPDQAGGASPLFDPDQAGNVSYLPVPKKNGGPIYAPAPQVAQSFTVNKAPQTINFAAPAGKVYLNPPFTLSATGGGSGNPVIFSSTTPLVCTTTGANGATVTILSVGLCTIDANQAGNANYLAAPPVTRSFTIGPASQTITFGAAPTVYVGGSGLAHATASSGLPVIYSSMTPTCGVNASTGEVSGISVGSCTIAANQPGNFLFNPALQVTQTFPVSASAASSVDLSVSKSVSPNPASTGKDVVFTILVENAGPGTATAVTLTDMLPGGTSFIWASTGCVNASGTVTCSLGSLIAGTSKQVKVVVRPPAAGPITNIATVTSAEFDIDVFDNSASASVAVNASLLGVPIPRYRLYSAVTLEHLFTTNLNEYTTLGPPGGNWAQEGTVGNVLDNPGSFAGVTAVPYYRLYDTSTQWHFWTTDANEYYTLTQGPPWSAEGVDGFILPTQAAGTIPLYRLNYPFIPGLHHWTIDTHEFNDLISLYGWVSEPGSGYVIP